MVVFEQLSYGVAERRWLDRVGKHYLQNAPPSCLFAVAARAACVGLFEDIPVGGALVGLCLVGRPVARAYPQDGSMGEVTRMVLLPGLPHGTASAMLRHVARVATLRGMRALIAYHDRTRHSGCIYRKAGFRKDGRVSPRPVGWASRSNRPSGEYQPAPKRRWRLELAP